MLPYQSVMLPPERRTEDLLGRMTLEEKAAQMMCVWQRSAETLVDAIGEFDIEKARRAFADAHGLGQVGRPSDAGGTGHEPRTGRNARQQAEFTNAIQKFFIEQSRLGIPVVFHDECLLGHAAIGGTSFPQPIGLGTTFDPDLVERLYAMTAAEARSRGVHQALTPVVDIPRSAVGTRRRNIWRRRHVVTRMGVAAVRGFQGDATFHDKTRVMTTLEHFVAHGQPEAGQYFAPANVSIRELREVFLPPFKAAVQDAGAISVMPSYNEVDGEPSHANRWLLRDVLRDAWGFRGFAVSDYYAIWELGDRPDTHGPHLAADKREAAVLSVRAGVNCELPEPDCYLHLVSLVRDGALAESELDDLVLLPANAIGATFVLEWVRAPCYAPTIPLIWAMFADVADYAEWKTHRRIIGAVFATILFALKTGLSLGGAIAGWLLSGYGYVPNQQQTEHALLGIRLSRFRMTSRNGAVGSPTLH